MSFRNLEKLTACTILVITMFMSKPTTASVRGQMYIPVFFETIYVSVNCDTASLNISCSFYSPNSTFIHYPSEVDMADSPLESSTLIAAMFSPATSSLTYVFNNTDPVTARANADAVTPSLSSAFGVTFTWLSTSPPGQYVNVTYAGGGISDMSSHAEMLKSKCMKSDLGGFSNALPSFVAQSPNSIISISAGKESGAFEWSYWVYASYATNIATGTGDHKIDILDLLGVSSLAPSPYAVSGSYYISNVYLSITSSSQIAFVSSEPVNTTDPSERGWFVYPQTDPNALSGIFQFASDPAPVSSLIFAFYGTIVPEFSPVTMTLALLASAICIIIIRKRLLKQLTRPENKSRSSFKIVYN